MDLALEWLKKMFKKLRIEKFRFNVPTFSSLWLNHGHFLGQKLADFQNFKFYVIQFEESFP